ncbi:dephospho-CoA kinase [Zhurongbacter thermophilus]|jgi:dephospho-CoA kinase
MPAGTMKVICITGPIASGKTLATHIIHNTFHVPMIKMDFIGHYVLTRSDVVEEVINLLGADVIEFGRLSRKKIAQKVFSNKSLLIEYNRLLHPIMSKQAEDIIDFFARRGFQSAVLEAAILHDAGWDHLCNEIWTVVSPPKTVYKRLGSERFFLFYRPRRKYQMTDDEYKRYADIVICNKYSKDIFAETIRRLWRQRVLNR